MSFFGLLTRIAFLKLYQKRMTSFKAKPLFLNRLLELQRLQLDNQTLLTKLVWYFVPGLQYDNNPPHNIVKLDNKVGYVPDMFCLFILKLFGLKLCGIYIVVQ